MPIANLVYLAAGHGGNDSGAMSPDNKHAERDQAIQIVDEVARLLRAHRIKVEIDPPSYDTHQSIARVNGRYPNFGSAFGIEIHRDSADTIKEPAASLRCGVYRGTRPSSVALGKKMVGAMIKAGAHSTSWNRSHTSSGHGSLAWVRQVKVLSVLMECGFMEGNNSEEHLIRLAGIAFAGIKAGYLS